MKLNITKGKINRPVKLIIYGAEGIGKTTLASQLPDPLFIDTEGGSAHLDVSRIEDINNWKDLVQACYEVAKEPNLCKTLVIDTADWAEQLALEELLVHYRKNSLSDFGYGSGYQLLQEKFSDLLVALDSVIDSGKNVCITAHAKMRKFEQPDESGAYDRWEMKLTKQVAPLLKEWCDGLLFCNYETTVIHGATPMDKNKVEGGKRVIYASHHPCWDAKNRFDLPDKLPLAYESIANIFKTQEEERALEAAADISTEEKEPMSNVQILCNKLMLDSIDEKKVLEFCVEYKFLKEGQGIDKLTEAKAAKLLGKYDKMVEFINKK